MRNDFEFGFFGVHIQGHDWGIPAAVIVALALITIVGVVFYRLSPRELLAVTHNIFRKGAESLTHPHLSSPAERSEGKGTQVETYDDSQRSSAANPRSEKKAAPPGSPSLARADNGVPNSKKRAARARRG